MAGSSLQNKCSVWVDHRFTRAHEPVIYELDEEYRMTILNRLRYAWFMSVVFVGVGVVVAMILSLDIGAVLFSGKIIFALLAASYLVAPLLERHLKFK